jgi:hypothetical protein
MTILIAQSSGERSFIIIISRIITLSFSLSLLSSLLLRQRQRPLLMTRCSPNGEMLDLLLNLSQKRHRHHRLVPSMHSCRRRR